MSGYTEYCREVVAVRDTICINGVQPNADRGSRKEYRNAISQPESATRINIDIVICCESDVALWQRFLGVPGPEVSVSIVFFS